MNDICLNCYRQCKGNRVGDTCIKYAPKNLGDNYPKMSEPIKSCKTCFGGDCKNCEVIKNETRIKMEIIKNSCEQNDKPLSQDDINDLLIDLGLYKG